MLQSKSQVLPIGQLAFEIKDSFKGIIPRIIVIIILRRVGFVYEECG